MFWRIAWMVVLTELVLAACMGWSLFRPEPSVPVAPPAVDVTPAVQIAVPQPHVTREVWM